MKYFWNPFLSLVPQVPIAPKRQKGLIALTITETLLVNFTLCLAATETWQASAQWLAVPGLIMQVKAISNSRTLPTHQVQNFLKISQITFDGLSWKVMEGSHCFVFVINHSLCSFPCHLSGMDQLQKVQKYT